jgi:hypothetical protein
MWSTTFVLKAIFDKINQFVFHVMYELYSMNINQINFAWQPFNTDTPNRKFNQNVFICLRDNANEQAGSPIYAFTMSKKCRSENPPYKSQCFNIHFSLLSLQKEGEAYEITVLSVCMFPTNNFWTSWQGFIKFSTEVMPLKVTSKPYYLIP